MKESCQASLDPVNVAANAAAYGMSKGRSELLLRQANKEIFAPRGLRVAIVKLNVVARAAEIPILDDEGKIVKGASLLAPVDNPEEESDVEPELFVFVGWAAEVEEAEAEDCDASN